MKVLWLCNVVIPEAAAAFGITGYNNAGWLSGMMNAIPDKAIDLHVCALRNGITGMMSAKVKKQPTIQIPHNTHPNYYNQALENSLKKLIEKIQPDIIHIQGTEDPHSLAMINACPDKKIVISIQGLTSVIAEHYLGYIRGSMNIGKSNRFIGTLCYRPITGCYNRRC